MRFPFFKLIIFFYQITFPQSDNTINTEQSLKITQTYIDYLNNRNNDSLFNIYHNKIVITNFPNDTLFYNREQLLKNQYNYFKNTKKSQVRILNKITLHNVVITEELSNTNTANRKITLYFTTNKNIKSMSFINAKKTTSNPEFIVNKQLEAYNQRNIDSFVETYSNNNKLYKFPEHLISEGHENLYNIYDSLFKKTPNLNAEIVNRIVLGNIVIDKEKVTKNDTTFYAIAIYEVENGKISKVTFIK